MPVTEEDVGIRAWTNDLPGFTGIIKQRYSDFRVNEVTVHGEVVRLTDLRPISRRREAKEAAAPAAASAADGAAEADPHAGFPQEGVDAALADFSRLAGDANAALLRDYVAAVLGRHPQPPAADAPASTGAAGASEPAAAAAQPADGAAEDADGSAAPDAGPAAPAAEATAGDASVPAAAVAAGEAPGSGPGRGRPPRHVVLQPIADKHTRGAVHGFFKAEPRLPPMRTETFQSTVKEGSNTAPSEGLIQVTVQKSGKRKRDPRDGGGGPGGRGGDWPGGTARFTRFVLHKENMDTQAALGLLSRMLHCSPGVFGFAGTKDKRAVTEQAVTAFKMPDTRLASLNKGLRGMQLGNFSFVEEALGLGAAGGNQFDVVLRGVTGATPQQVVSAVEGLARHGFVNYFGLQRFGSGLSATHQVGALLLNGKWEAAARLILQGPADDRPDIAAARAAFLEKGDIRTALAGLPRFLTAERTILATLQRLGPAHWLPALEAIPRNLRSMYVHAYQSYLWNMATSQRIQQHGASAVVAGDLVLPPAAAAGDADAADDPAEALDLEGREAGGTRAAGRLAAVHVVSAAEAAAGAFDIADVVLPLPGARIRYPEHDTAQVYKQLAADDGVSLERSPHNVRSFSIQGLAGDYRRLVQRPRATAWRLLRYGAPDAELATVPPEGSAGVTMVATSANFYESSDSAPPAVTTPPADDDERPLALQLRFQLPPSVYATMAIRQATKASTATAEHRTATLAAIAKAQQSGGAEASNEAAPKADSANPLEQSKGAGC